MAQRRAERTGTCPQPAPCHPMSHPRDAPLASTTSAPPRSGFCCSFFPFRGTPGSFCSSQAASACSNFHLFQLESLPRKGARNLSSGEAGQGDADNRPLPRLAPLLRASFIICRQRGHAQPPPAPARVNQVWPLPTPSRSPGREHAAYRRQAGAWGLTQD